MYEYFSNYFSRINIIELPIREVYIVKVGFVGVLPFKLSQNPDNLLSSPLEKLEEQWSKLCYDESIDPKNIYSKIVEALGSHPNIFDLNIIDIQNDHIFSTGNVIGTFVSGNLFHFRVHLPKHIQKYYGDSLANYIEEFDVLSDGSLFIAFSKINDDPGLTYFAHEYREIFHNQIEKETKFSAPIFGPTPIHPSFYFVFRETHDNKSSILKRTINSDGDDLFITFDGEKFDIIDTIIDFYFDIQNDIEKYYSLVLDRMLLFSYIDEITAKFSILSGFVASLLDIHWWQFIKMNNSSKNGKKTLSEIYTRLMGYESKNLDYSRNRSSLLNSINKNDTLMKINEYFSRQTEPDFQLPNSIFNAIDHFEKELESFSTTQTVIISSLLGATVAAILTAIGTYLIMK